jgi:hypothetical protein
MNHKKLLLTLTLCLCLCALLCMAVTASASEVQNTGSHSHALCEGLRDNCTDPAHSEGNHGSVTFATELRQDGNTLYIGDQVWTYEHNVGYILPAGTYYLGTDLTLDHQIRISNSREVKVTLCLNGKTITCTENYDAVIQTPTTYPVEFTLCDCRPSDSVGKITHANGIRGVGVELKNNNAVNDVAHKFIMYNGCITGNKTTHGAGVFLYSNTTFTMYGGSITENECNSDTYLPCGGGVYAFTNATFTMYGGDITKNKADYGGGVSTSGDTANFTMYGGSITENHANKSGGGIYSNSNNISIYGGSVTDNSVTKNGKAGGIYVSSSDTLTVGGNVNISGNWQGDSKESGSKSNVYLNGNTSGSSATIVIENKLTGAPIGVTTANAPTAGNPVTIVTGNSIEETYKDSFQADNAAYGVSYNSTDKVLQLHKHSGGTATCMAPAVCTTCGQPYGNTNPNNHDLEHHEAKAATCTEVGWNAYNTCKREGCSYTTYKEIAALNHALVHHEAQAPTCTAVGWEAYDTCSRCSYTTKVEKQKTPHTYGETWVKGQDGHWKVCEVCKGRSEVKPHDWKDATTSAPKTCTVCGATTGTKLSTYYYYSPAKTEDTPGSPKAGDPGVLLYAGLALASLTGLACTAKKRH